MPCSRLLPTGFGPILKVRAADHQKNYRRSTQNHSLHAGVVSADSQRAEMKTIDVCPSKKMCVEFTNSNKKGCFPAILLRVYFN